MKRMTVHREETLPILQFPQDIPQNEWLPYLDLFSAQHHGWTSTIELVSGDYVRPEARDLPFDGITVDRRGSSMIEITLGLNPGDHITHTIPNVRRINWHTPDELEIETDDDLKTYLRCEPPTRF
jgi:hypothetical protein